MGESDSANSSERKTPKRLARLTREQESDLRFYFEHGVDRLESPSNMAAQLERAEFYFTHARPCLECGGTRAVFDDDGNTITAELPGSGFVTSSADFKMRRQVAKLVGAEFELPGDLTCPKCNGRGWVDGPKSNAHGPLTARPSGSSVQGSGVPDTGGNDSVARTGKLDRQLAILRRQDHRLYAALASRFSPQGYERGISSLWHLTPAGKMMLRGNGMGLPERQYFENLSDRLTREQDSKKSAKLANQIEAANDQAERLEQEAIDAWQAALGAEAEAA